jgi:hypothetical protein
MKIILTSLVFGSLIVGTALAQTSATSQSGAAASNDTSVSADKSGAQVSSNTSTNAAADPTITKHGRQVGAAGDLQSGTAIEAKAGKKPLTSSGNVSGTHSAGAGAGAGRGSMGNAGATSDGTLNSAGSARGASMGSAAASGAHLHGFEGSAGLDHDSQGTFGARRANLGSSTAGSGMLNTRGSNAPRRR